MFYGIDDDAEWLALLALAVALPFVIAAVVTVVDLWTRSRRLVLGDRRVFDALVVAVSAMAVIAAVAFWSGWGAVFAVVVIVLTVRLAEVALRDDPGLVGWRRSAVAARRALLLGLVVGIVGALA